MKRIAFRLPLNRFEETDKLATRAALRQAFNITDRDIDIMIADAQDHRQFMLHFGATPEQFATFLIQRNSLGSRNLFAELNARLIDQDAPVQNHRIVDFVFVGPNYAEEGYRIHDSLPPHMVARTNEARAERAAFRSSADVRRATVTKFDMARAARAYGGRDDAGALKLLAEGAALARDVIQRLRSSHVGMMTRGRLNDWASKAETYTPRVVVNSAAWTGHEAKLDPVQAFIQSSVIELGGRVAEVEAQVIEKENEITRRGTRIATLENKVREARTLIRTILAGNWASHYARIARIFMGETDGLV